jgi:peptidoglycan/LPS O-acetylase OafA/YrhL
MKVKERSFGLDLARAVAIILVVISHFIFKFEFLGMFGVELFFALSGYLIGQIMWRSFNREYLSFRVIFNFYQRRWYRTVPNYFLFLLLMIPFHIYIKNEIINWSIIQDYLYFGQSLLTPSASFYGISWSLCIEEWFYLLFPIPLYLFAKLTMSKQKSFFITVLIFVILSFSIRFYLNFNGITRIRGITFARLDSICLGVFVALLKIHYKTVKDNLLFLFGIVILFGCIIVLSYNSYTDFKYNTFILFFVPLSFALMLPKTEKIRLTSTNFTFIKLSVTKLSLWSYSIYLSHIPIVFCVYYLTEGYRNTTVMNILSKIFAFGVTLLISGVIYKYFEVPLTHRRPKSI